VFCTKEEGVDSLHVSGCSQHDVDELFKVRITLYHYNWT
jgi:hypothetical protein